jgi:hypothetical protein
LKKDNLGTLPGNNCVHSLKSYARLPRHLPGRFIFGEMLVGLPAAQALAASSLYQGLWVGVTSACGLAALVWEGTELPASLSGSRLDR